MSSISAGRPAVRTRAARSEGWFAALGVKGRRAFRAAYTGYTLQVYREAKAKAKDRSGEVALRQILSGTLLRTTLAASLLATGIGRRRTFALFAACAGAALVVYFAVPSGSNTILLLVGFPLGFFASGCFSGFGSYLAELYPTRARATGGGFLLALPETHGREIRAVE